MRDKIESSTVEVISSSLSDLPIQAPTLRHLFKIPVSRGKPERLLIKNHRKNSCFLIWLNLVTKESTWTIDDATIAGEKTLSGASRAGSSSFLFSQNQSSTILVVISKFVGSAKDSLLLPLDEKEAPYSDMEEDRDWFRGLEQFSDRNILSLQIVQ
jgi:hypothetical protein